MCSIILSNRLEVNTKDFKVSRDVINNRPDDIEKIYYLDNCTVKIDRNNIKILGKYPSVANLLANSSIDSVNMFDLFHLNEQETPHNILVVNVKHIKDGNYKNNLGVNVHIHLTNKFSDFDIVDLGERR